MSTSDKQMILSIAVAGLLILTMSAVADEPDQGNRRGPANRGGGEMPVREIFRNMPEPERQRLRELQQHGPQAFRDELRLQLRNRQRQGSAADTDADAENDHDSQREHIKQLVRQYHQAQTDAARQQLRQQLRQAIISNQQQRLQQREQQLTQMQQELEHLRAMLAERRQNFDAICDTYLQQLLQSSPHPEAGERRHRTPQPPAP